MRPAVFLDRDGTLNEEVGYLDRLDRLILFPWSVDAVRLLNRGGFAVVVVTNQAGVARGFFTESFVHDVHRRIDEYLGQGGARVDGYYYCPHHPDAVLAPYRLDCDCRKPRPGMIQRAAQDLGLDLAHSFVVGDRWLDMGLARAVGAEGVLVKTGYGHEEASRPDEANPAAAIVENLMEAVSWILMKRQPR